jgi:hypothetical protein
MQNILRGNVFCLNQNNLIEVKGIWFCWATDNQVRIDIVYLRVEFCMWLEWTGW